MVIYLYVLPSATLGPHRGRHLQIWRFNTSNSSFSTTLFSTHLLRCCLISPPRTFHRRITLHYQYALPAPHLHHLHSKNTPEHNDTFHPKTPLIVRQERTTSSRYSSTLVRIRNRGLRQLEAEREKAEEGLDEEEGSRVRGVCRWEKEDVCSFEA